jgi:hypothetical protein
MSASWHHEPLSEGLVPVLDAVQPHIAHILLGHIGHHLSDRIDYLDPISETE